MWQGWFPESLHGTLAYLFAKNGERPCLGTHRDHALRSPQTLGLGKSLTCLSCGHALPTDSLEAVGLDLHSSIYDKEELCTALQESFKEQHCFNQEYVWCSYSLVWKYAELLSSALLSCFTELYTSLFEQPAERTHSPLHSQSTKKQQHTRLQGRGIVGVCAKNQLGSAIGDLACLISGLVCVPLACASAENLDMAHLAGVLKSTQVSVVVVAAQFVGQFLAASRQPDVHVRGLIVIDLHDGPDDIAALAALENFWSSLDCFLQIGPAPSSEWCPSCPPVFQTIQVAHTQGGALQMTTDSQNSPKPSPWVVRLSHMLRKGFFFPLLRLPVRPEDVACVVVLIQNQSCVRCGCFMCAACCDVPGLYQRIHVDNQGCHAKLSATLQKSFYTFYLAFSIHHMLFCPYVIRRRASFASMLVGRRGLCGIRSQWKLVFV
jgi:hypothetical protein